MVIMVAGLLPALGLHDWSLRAPPSFAAAELFTISLGLVVLLSTAFQMLLNVIVVHSMTDRGANLLLAPFVVLFTGSEVPLPFYPDGLHTFLFVQPLAGVIDIPFRIYSGHLAGAQALTGIALQAFWIVVLIAVGRRYLAHAMHKQEVQGG